MVGTAGVRFDLIDEIDAFRQGFGRAVGLTNAVRDALLLVPVVDDRVVVTPLRGIDWILAFTSEDQYIRYLAARELWADAEFQWVLGHRIFDALLPALPGPTGMLLDVSGEIPMAFPPDESSLDSTR
ncbi:hypothetical protein ABH922_001082 [Rhodococcus sp. 27YEA15]|uniref:SseB family protein n=1 Tax=Rhodococcus sp. 27YEA15 TaxID=3156259 RepID=UPI003C79FA8E